jgi:uncharacterized protein (DUF3820 family)
MSESLTHDSPMPFGKHKGTPLKELPPSYVAWALENLDDRNAELKTVLATLPKTTAGADSSTSKGPLSADSPMPFGKHKGTLLKDLPRDYAEWLVGNLGDGKEDIKAAIRAAHGL